MLKYPSLIFREKDESYHAIAGRNDIKSDNYLNNLTSTIDYTIISQIESDIRTGRHVDLPSEVASKRVDELVATNVKKLPIEVDRNGWVQIGDGRYMKIHLTTLNTSQHFQVLINNRLNKLGWTVPQLATKLGLDRDGLDNIIGLHKQPNLVMIDRIMTALRFDTDVQLGEPQTSMSWMTYSAGLTTK